MNECDCISLEIAAIRHRVANCFQTLADLARTPAGGGDRAEERWSLERVEEQIGSVANLRALLDRGVPQGLTDHLAAVASFWCHIGRERGIEVMAQFDRAPTGPGRLAVPLAMIANTALLNCFDHGFPKGRKGLVKIGLGGTVEGGLCLTVIDDGVGWEVDPATRMGRGCRLIADLAGSVGGRAEWRRHALCGSILSVLVPPASRAA